MTIVLEGIDDPLVRALITRKLGAMLRRRGVKAVAARVGFVDENGPKGGVDIRCGLTVGVPRRPTVYVEGRGKTPRLAFDEGLATIERELARERDQARDVRRRPKKYFAAKRLLAS